MDISLNVIRGMIVTIKIHYVNLVNGTKFTHFIRYVSKF